jgi:hypothetical protein
MTQRSQLNLYQKDLTEADLRATVVEIPEGKTLVAEITVTRDHEIETDS